MLDSKQINCHLPFPLTSMRIFQQQSRTLTSMTTFPSLSSYAVSVNLSNVDLVQQLGELTWRVDLKTDLDEALWWGDLMSELKESTLWAYSNNRLGDMTWWAGLVSRPSVHTWTVDLVRWLKESTHWGDWVGVTWRADLESWPRGWAWWENLKSRSQT